MSAVVTQISKEAKPLSLCFLFFFFIAVFQITTAYGDSDCVGNNCDQDGKYWVKVKRLPDELTLPDWGGEELVSGDTKASSGKQFCTIAFLEGSPRTMFNPEISIDGPSSSGSYVLKKGSRSIPVTFDIVSAAGKAPQVKTEFTPGQRVTLIGQKDYDQCRDNELIITATVRREDILNTANTGNYSSLFRLYSQSTMDGKSLGPAWMEFEVELEILSVIQISKLDNIALIPSGNSAIGSHQFCVYAMGSNKFALEAFSQTGDSQPQKKLALKNGDSNYINYTLTISDATGTRKSYDKNRIRKGFSPSDEYQCSSPNMTVEVIAPDIKGATGTYIDTMTFTVTPQ